MRMIFSQSGETSKFASFAFVCPSLRGFCSVQYKEGKSTGGKILKRIVNFLPVLFFFFLFSLIIFAYARVVLVPRCLHFLYDKKKSGSRKRIGKQTIIITLNEKGEGVKNLSNVSEQKGIEKKKTN